jgi:hypothetical protein
MFVKIIFSNKLNKQEFYYNNIFTFFSENYQIKLKAGKTQILNVLQLQGGGGGDVDELDERLR